MSAAVPPPVHGPTGHGAASLPSGAHPVPAVASVQDPVPAELAPVPPPYGSYAFRWPGATGVMVRIARTKLTPVVVPVRVVVDGRVVAAGLGDTFIPLSPGHHEVAIAYQRPPTDAVSVQPVSVSAGQVVDVHYALPIWARANGAIGLTPQPHQGKAIYLILALPLVLVVLLFTLLIVFVALLS